MRTTYTLQYALVAAVMATFATGTEAVAQTASNVICNGCVNSRDIANGSVTGRDIKNGSIGGVDIRDGSIAPADLAVLPKIEENTVVAATDPVSNAQYGGSVASVTISVPVPGKILLNASAIAIFAPAVTPRSIDCYLAKVAGPYNTGKYVGAFVVAEGSAVQALAITDVLTELSTGPQTYRLFCQATVATGVAISAPSITALYVPLAP